MVAEAAEGYFAALEGVVLFTVARGSLVEEFVIGHVTQTLIQSRNIMFLFTSIMKALLKTKINT